MNQEFAEKRRRIANLIESRGLSGLALGRSSSWSWATCGREANVAVNSESAVALLLFTPRRDYLIASTIEMPRLLAEEAAGLPYEPVEFPWQEPARREALLAELAGEPLGADLPLRGADFLAPALIPLRSNLTAAEQERFAALGRDSGAAIEAAARAVCPGMSEYQVAGLLSAECWQRGLTPVVTLIAADERVHRFRHPPPTDRPVERYVLLVLCARRYGLIASASRLVHFGPPPADLQARALACARIDAALHGATRPGGSLAAIFATLQTAYAAEGFADEWRAHHQGGLAGYENREQVANPTVQLEVQAGQVYAWNPSIAGVKSEDTILIAEHGYQVLTATGNWPQLVVESAGRLVERPAILEH